MRIPFVIILSVLLGVIASIANADVLHSSITYTLQAGEVRNFYLREQVGSIAIRPLTVAPGVSFGGGCGVALGQMIGTTQVASVSADDHSPVEMACMSSDTSDWYVYAVNQNATHGSTVSFEIYVREPITAVNRKASFSLPPVGFQYIRIPAEANHGLSFHFDFQCDQGSDSVEISVKSASANSFEQLSRNLLWENEDILILVHNIDDSSNNNNCTLTYQSRETAIIKTGLTTLTVDSDFETIGTRYVPTSPLNNVLFVERSPAIPFWTDSSRAYSNFYNYYYITDGKTNQNFVFDTTEMIDGDQLNVTVTALPTILLSSGTSHSFECKEGGEHHVFALIGEVSKNTGAVLDVSQVDGIQEIRTYFVSDEYPINNEEILSGSFIRYADKNGVVWVMEAICSTDGNAAITATLPVIQTVKIGTNTISIPDTEQYMYLMLPQGPNQSALGVHSNLSTVGVTVSGYSLRYRQWYLNNDQKEDVFYPFGSVEVSPAWWFVLYSDTNQVETLELTLTAYPIVTLESGKTHSFVTPDDSYDYHMMIAKMESSNGMGHALNYIWEYDSNAGSANVEITENGFYSDDKKKKRSVPVKGTWVSLFGSSTFYFAIRTNSVPLNLTTTFAPVTTAVNNVADFSRGTQPNEEEPAFHTIIFPAAKRHNAVFYRNASSFVQPIALGYEGIYTNPLSVIHENQDTGNGYSAVVGHPDSMSAWYVARIAAGQAASIHMESIASIDTCNSMLDCHGHGSCFSDNSRCDCRDNYSGDWCDVAPAPSDDNDNSGAEQMVVIAACQLVALVAMLFIAF